MAGRPEVWLRGPVEGIISVLQPAAHAFLQVSEDVPGAVAGLSESQIWARPGGTAAIGYHVLHIAGGTDRLLSYSRGASLTSDQLVALAAERTAHDSAPPLELLVPALLSTLEAALSYLRSVTDDELFAPREVGRQRLPSTTLGLIFHAAEHATRHAGQIATLRSVVTGGHGAPPTR